MSLPRQELPSLYNAVLQQHCDRALLLHDGTDEDGPRAVFGKLMVSERCILLQAAICGRDLRQMYFGKLEPYAFPHLTTLNPTRYHRRGMARCGDSQSCASVQ